jgi:hypothetical protein
VPGVEGLRFELNGWYVLRLKWKSWTLSHAGVGDQSLAYLLRNCFILSFRFVLSEDM